MASNCHKSTIEVLQQMFSLRPYFQVGNSFVYDLEEQLKPKISSMTVADYIAFAEGAEAYLRKKYGEDLALQFLGSREHWRGVARFKQDMTALWEKLDVETRQQLKSEPIKAVMDKHCDIMLPTGGKFDFV
jgi:hypothetical protein